MNKPVNFEIAKLLKEKGYKLDFGDNQKFYFPDTRELTENHRGNNYPAPTISEVVMWLYEKHGIWIYALRMDQKEFYWSIDTDKREFTSGENFKTPTEAYEAAIEYTLKNLL